MASQTIRIQNKRGDKLTAYIELPPNQRPRAYCLFAHCFTCHSNLNAVRNISREIALKGFGVVRFDFTGLGRSEGKFADSHFAGNIEDLMTMVSYMRENLMAPCLLVGHSLGGAAVLVAGSQIDEVEAVVSIAAPSDVLHVGQHFLPQIDLKKEEAQEVSIAGREFLVDTNFVKGFEGIDLLKEVRKLKKNVLLLHSPLDETVDIDHAKKIYQAAFHPKSFISLDGADHLLTNKKHSRYAGRIIASWMTAIFPDEKEELDTRGEQAVAHLDLMEDNFTTTIQMGRHRLIADEPVSIGGDDFGPSPYDLLVAGLAACTTMTLKMYAGRKKWDLQEVYVYLSHEKRHGDDMENEKSLKMDHIDKRIVVKGNLTAEQKERLLDISKKCPVHRTLEAQIVINSELLHS